MPAMFVSGYLVLLLAVAGLDRVKGEDDDFSRYTIQAACHEPNGQVRSVGCLKKMGDNDLKFVLLYFEGYFNQKDMTIEKVIARGCKDPEEGKKAFNEYYDDRKKHEGDPDKFTPDDNKKLAEARECIFKMVSECMVKEQMGVLF